MFEISTVRFVDEWPRHFAHRSRAHLGVSAGLAHAPAGFRMERTARWRERHVRKQQQITNENLLCSFVNRFPPLSGAV